VLDDRAVRNPGRRPGVARPDARPAARQRPVTHPRGEQHAMAIEVRIPTILRTHTGGNKTVEGTGDTLAALVDDLDAKHPGLKNRLVTEEGKLHRFVNVYVNDEDVRFTGALDTQVKDGDSVTILPAVAGGC
jgi:sulfur-carrier protein